MTPLHWSVGDHAEVMGRRGEIVQLIRYQDGDIWAVLHMLDQDSHLATSTQVLDLPLTTQRPR